MTTAFVIARSNGALGVQVDDSLRAKGYVWDSANYRAFQPNGDYYMGFTKTGEGLIVIVRAIRGIFGYALARPSEWATRTTLTYGTGIN